MDLVWTQFAIDDRQQIFDYIAQENPIAALSCDDEISKQVGSLARSPDIGRPGKVVGTRELVIKDTPFIVAYVVLDHKVQILRVLHGAQMWPENF